MPLDHPPDPAHASALGEALRLGGYEEDALRERLGPYPVGDPALASRQLGDDALATLIRAFYLGERVPEVELRAALGRRGLVAARSAHAVSDDGEDVMTEVTIEPFEQSLIAHDRPDPTPRKDHVVGVGPSTRLLTRLAFGEPTGSVIDLGTGSGVFALLAARTAQRVTGVDINPRALAFCRFNAALNDVTAVEWIEGDFRGRSNDEADLVMLNPPYILGPESEVLFRDAGGGEPSAEAVQLVAGSLRHGGTGVAACSWTLAPREEVGWKPERWVSSTGCDGLALITSVNRPGSYAARFCGIPPGTDDYGEALDRWIEHFEERGVDSIVHGVVVLRRGDGANWFDHRTISALPGTAARRQLDRIFELHELVTLPDDALDALQLRAVDHRLDQRLLHRGGRYELMTGELAVEGGLPLSADIEPLAIQTLFGLDGTRQLGAVTSDAAAATGTAPELVREAARRSVRELLRIGAVVPHDRDG